MQIKTKTNSNKSVSTNYEKFTTAMAATPLTKYNPQILVFSGLNRLPIINDEELSSAYNLSFKNYPCLSCRPSREIISTLVTPHALFSVNDKLAWVNDAAFYYNNAFKGVVSAGTKSMVDFNGKIVMMPDKKTYDYTSDTFASITSDDMDFICVHMNRVFGVKGNDVHACKQGDVTNWNQSEGVATDSWHADVPSEGGSFTGIVSYQNHPVIFKADLMYELYGSLPSNFTLQPINKVGCISNKAIVEINSILYFCGRKGIYAYSGGVPRLMSNKLNETYSNAVFGTDGRILYASLYNGSTWKLYTYDTLTEKWLQEDNLQVVEFTRIGDNCYALSSTGALYKFNSGTEAVSWSMETNDFTEQTFAKKYNDKIRLRVNLHEGSTLNLFVKTDNNEYPETPNETITTAGLNSYTFILPVVRADRFKVKLTGTGSFEIYAFGREYAVGSDI